MYVVIMWYSSGLLVPLFVVSESSVVLVLIVFQVKWCQLPVLLDCLCCGLGG